MLTLQAWLSKQAQDVKGLLEQLVYLIRRSTLRCALMYLVEVGDDQITGSVALDKFKRLSVLGVVCIISVV